MNEGTYTPPLYLDLYNFLDGAQNDIFENTTGKRSYEASSADLDAKPTQPSGSSSAPSQITQGSSAKSTDPASQPLGPPHVSSHDGASHTNAEAATPTPRGHNHHKPDQCTGSHRSGHSRDYPHDEAHAEEQALPPAWGAHHRRSVGKHHP